MKMRPFEKVWRCASGPAIVEAARTWIGTPWDHDQRCKGFGVDCTGLVVGVFAECGAPLQDVRGYTRGDEYETMMAAIEAQFFRVDGELWPGDLLVFRNTALAPPLTITNHVAIYTGPEDGMIHAWATPSINAVCEHPFDDFWRRCLVGVYRYRGAVWLR